jgi:hypothetical protein
VIAGRGLAATVVILRVTIAESATAQDDGPALAPHRFTLSAGVVGSSGYPVGDQSADLRRNAVGNPAPLTLFRAESTFEAAPGFDARVDFAVTRSLAIEVGAAYSTPRLEVTVTGDSESDANVQLGEEVSQYTVDVSGLWHLPRLSMGRRVRPYIMLGGGYLRQLHEDRLVAETGGLIHAGGGVRVWFTGGSASARASGLRAEARLVRRSGGIGFDDDSRLYPIFSILGFFGL